MSTLPDYIVTRRLVLRLPAERDIPEIVREIGNWNVACWLGRVPHPYVARHARAWLASMRCARAEGRDMSLVVALAAPATRPRAPAAAASRHWQPPACPAPAPQGTHRPTTAAAPPGSRP